MSQLHKRLEPKRRNSEVLQEKLLESLAQEDKKSALMSTSALAKALPVNGKERLQKADDADDFSPNNPLDRNTAESGSLAPLDKAGYTEMEQKVVLMFQERLMRVQKELPKGIVLKIFRTGDECTEEAARLMAVTT